MAITVSSITVPQDGVPVGSLCVGFHFVRKNAQNANQVLEVTGFSGFSRETTTALPLANRSVQAIELDSHELVYPVQLWATGKAYTSLKDYALASFADITEVQVASDKSGTRFHLHAEGAISKLNDGGNPDIRRELLELIYREVEVKMHEEFMRTMGG